MHTRKGLHTGFKEEIWKTVLRYYAKFKGLMAGTFHFGHGVTDLKRFPLIMGCLCNGGSSEFREERYEKSSHFSRTVSNCGGSS